MDIFGEHSINCRNGGYLQLRHNLGVKILAKYIRGAGILVQFEAGKVDMEMKTQSTMIEGQHEKADTTEDEDLDSLDREDPSKSRPADLYLPHGTQEKLIPIAIDYGSINPMQKAMVKKQMENKGNAAAHVEERKHKKYDEYLKTQNVEFIVVALETHGRWGKECKPFIKSILRQNSERNEIPYSIVAGNFWQEMSLALQRVNAKAIIDRYCNDLEGDPGAF
jgi:hypothetical protein